MRDRLPREKSCERSIQILHPFQLLSAAARLRFGLPRRFFLGERPAAIWKTLSCPCRLQVKPAHRRIGRPCLHFHCPTVSFRDNDLVVRKSPEMSLYEVVRARQLHRACVGQHLQSSSLVQRRVVEDRSQPSPQRFQLVDDVRLRIPFADAESELLTSL
jgi:hypothetical protein